MERSLSIPEWHRMAAEGAAPPVRIQLNGDSMFPLIRRNRDYVTVGQLQEKPVAGDLVLFADGNKERYIVHRIWKVEDRKVLIWGDNCPAADGWFQMDVILGKIVLIERGNHIIHPDPNVGLRWAKIWHKARPGFYFAWRIKNAIVRIIEK